MRLCLYFVVFFGATLLIIANWPEATLYMPVGGHDALDTFGAESVSDVVAQFSGSAKATAPAASAPTGQDIIAAAFFLILHLSGTVLLMIPLTWTYMASKQETSMELSNS